MPDLLLELLSEEIPARMQRLESAWLCEGVLGEFRKAGLSYESAENYWTPRRLVMHVRGLAEQSPGVQEERKGPRVDAPQKAIDGFLRSAGLDSVSQAQIHSDPKKGDFYVALIERSGRKAEEIIAEILPDILRKFPWRKSMRWGEASSDPGSFRWIRPLRSILCILNDGGKKPRVIEFEVGGIRSGGVTQGHRFMAPKPFAPSDFDDYVKKLKEANVILDPEERMKVILDNARDLCGKRKLTLVEDDARAEEVANLVKVGVPAEEAENLAGRNLLSEEVANLVEWPVVLMGSFPERYLLLPDDVIRLTIATHQKCFVMRDSSGKLAPHFILVSNIEAKEDGGTQIIRGNERVVAARLADAKFFWESDLRVVKSSVGFERWVGELNHVVFHAELGSQGDRVQRIELLAKELAAYVGTSQVQSEIKKLAEKAAHLAKADLQSAMVGEFPELQGRMGGLYAREAGKEDDVALAIEEHYKPLGPSDSIPVNEVSVAVALADKIDTLAGFWLIGKKPTGSGDPFGLRRAALGILSVLGVLWPSSDEGGKRRFPEMPSLLEIFSRHAKRFPNVDEKKAMLIARDLLDFIRERLKIHLKKYYSVREDFADAVMASQGDNLFMVAHKAFGMMRFSERHEDAFMNLLHDYRRVANILAAEEKKGALPSDDDINEDILCPAEVDLLNGIRWAKDEESPINDEELEQQALAGEALAELSGLHEYIERFFEEVLVNAEDESVRANRLKLLARLRDFADEFADFSKVQE